MTRVLNVPDDLHRELARMIGLDLESKFSSRPTSLKGVTSRLLCVRSVPSALVTKRPAAAVFQPVLSGMWALGSSVLFALRRDSDDLQVLLGTYGQHGSHEVIQSLLHGHLPGIKSHIVDPQPLVDDIVNWPCGVALIGIPSPSQDSLTPLLQGMGTSDWLYLVLAQPLCEREIQEAIAQLGNNDRQLVNTYLRKGTVEADNQPIAKAYHKMLELALSQYRRGVTLGMWRVRTFLFAKEETALRVGAGLLVSALAGKQSLPRPIRILRSPRRRLGRKLEPSPYSELHTDSLCQLVHLPACEQPGYAVRPTPEYGQSPPDASGPTVTIGSLQTATGVKGKQVKLSIDGLLRHLFIAGITGSGKTRTAQHLLLDLWREHKVPFLVIEPAKREYRALRGAEGLEDLLIFTLGDEREAPFRINPLEIPKGVPVQTHIDLLRTLFQATFAGLYPPMPYLLEQALTEVYLDYGWDLARDVGKVNSRYPTMQDLCSKAMEVADRAGYDNEVTQNVRTALRVRLESLLIGSKGKLLNNRRSLPLEELLRKPVILELASIGDREIVAFMIGVLLIRLYEYRVHSQRRKHGNYLQHLTLVEEAHRLLAHQSAFQHPDLSSIRSHSIETFCQLLTEVRAFGEGIAVVDQSPAKLHPDILRGTNTKIVHRLLAEDDRKAIAGCTNMTAEQTKSLALLAVRQAAVYSEGFHTPILTQVSALHLDDEAAAKGDSVAEHMQAFYKRFPLQDAPDQLNGVLPFSTTVTDVTPEITRTFEDLIATTAPEDLWSALAKYLREAVNGRGQLSSDKVPVRALELGVALANSMDLPANLKQLLRANLAPILFSDEEER